MNKLQLLLIFSVILTVGASLGQFSKWSDSYGKKYNSMDELKYRHDIWMMNQRRIDYNNRYNTNFRMEMNEYGDMTWDEFKSMKMGLSVPNVLTKKNQAFPTWRMGDMPRSVNWTDKGVVTRVKNQEACGSCWAFSTTGMVESMHAIQTGNLVSLSEENLIDCTFSYGNGGCQGGLPTLALEYIIDNKGIDTEESYPLTSVTSFQCVEQYMCPCNFNRDTVGATVKGYRNIISGNETDLQYTIAFSGPVSVAIDAEDDMQFYKSGVFYDKTCSNHRSNLNHAVLAVGYGTSNDGKEFYIVKNSWGTEWGMEGYILMARNNNNMCGISTMAVSSF